MNNPFKSKPRPYAGLMLARNGNIRVEDLDAAGKHYTVSATETHGVEEAYVLEAGARFRLNETLRPGDYILHVQGDPEPVTTRQPRGYGAALLAYLIGGFFQMLFSQTRRPDEQQPWDWKRWAMIGGAVLILVIVAWSYYTTAQASPKVR